MDYSLLVGVHTGELAGGIIPEPEIYHSKKFQNCFGGILSATSKATYFIGIIDIFQQYTAGKKVERFLKTKLLRRATNDGGGSGKYSTYKKRQEKHTCVDCHRQNTVYFPIDDKETHIFEFICTFCRRKQECESCVVKKRDTNISSTNPTKYMNRFLEYVTNKVIPENTPYLTQTLGFKHYNDMLNDSEKESNGPGGGRHANFMTPVNPQYAQHNNNMFMHNNPTCEQTYGQLIQSSRAFKFAATPTYCNCSKRGSSWYKICCGGVGRKACCDMPTWCFARNEGTDFCLILNLKAVRRT